MPFRDESVPPLDELYREIWGVNCAGISGGEAGNECHILTPEEQLEELVWPWAFGEPDTTQRKPTINDRCATIVMMIRSAAGAARSVW